MTQLGDGGRLARVIASDLVSYFRAPDSPFAGSERRARDFAAHGLCLVRSRFGEDDALERYYADCIGGAFESLTLAPVGLAALRTSATPFAAGHPPEEEICIVFGPGKS